MDQWVGSKRCSYFSPGNACCEFYRQLGFELIMYLSERAGLFSEEIRIFWAIGLLGSFTTMSIFSYESFRLLEQNENMLFGLNMVGTVILTLAAVYLGKLVVLNFMVGTK